MFPLAGLSAKPVVGSLEVPLKTNDLQDTFYGESTMGDSSAAKIHNGKRNTLWSSSYENGDVVITDGARRYVIFTRTSITELSVCFDSFMLPTIAYVYNDESYIRFYDQTVKSYVVRNLTELSKSAVRTPRVTYDDRRRQFRYSGTVILGFILESQLVIRSSDDRYRSARIIHDFADNKNYLNQISMGDNNRLHFVPYRFEE